MDDSECPICFEPLKGKKTIRIKCGHVMHAACTKQWYTKSTAEKPTCPMCRGPFVFKGSYDTLSRWESERDAETSSILEEFMEDVFDTLDNNIHDELHRRFWLRYLKDSLILFHVMTELGYDDEDIEEALWSDLWISPRVVTRTWGTDELWTFPEKATRYPYLLKFTQEV